jgi:glycosyltransferase involved in cell wall biosynthesis
MKKALVVINNLKFGGAERLVVDQINELVKCGYSVELLTLVSNSGPSFQDGLVLSSAQINHLEIGFKNLRNFFKLRSFLAKRKDFLVITHLFLTNTLVRLAAIFMYPRPRLVAYEHNVYAREKKSKHFLVDRILARVTYRIIAVSEEVRIFLIKKGLPQAKVVSVENGIATEFIGQLPSSSYTTRRVLGYTENDLLVVSVGSVVPQKGYEIIKSVAMRLITKYPNLHFIICGSAESIYARELKSEIVKAGLGARVNFLGARSDARAIVKSADIFFMPSLWEGLSISLLEALAMGKCVLATDIPSMKSIVKDSGAGLVFTPGDTDKAVNCLDTLLANPEKRDFCAQRAKELSFQYSIQSNVSKLLEVTK